MPRSHQRSVALSLLKPKTSGSCSLLRAVMNADKMSAGFRYRRAGCPVLKTQLAMNVSSRPPAYAATPLVR
jgi:hypothetical protein